jgi:DNA modification methylase
VIHTGDCIEVMAGMEADSVDAVVTDPPYGLEFMGKGWDKFGAEVVDAVAQGGFQDGNGGNPFSRSRVRFGAGKSFMEWCEAWGREALRVTKPGGYLLAFGGTRTHHRLVCGLEDAGWIIRDELDWIYACLSDDTELLTREHGWVRYNRASEGDHAAAFDPATGELRWERIEAVHQYDHDGSMVEVGPSLVTLNHRVILDEATARVPSVSSLWGDIPEAVGMGEAHGQPVLFQEVQWDATHSRSPVSAGARVERGATSAVVGGDAGPRKSCLERRSYRVQEARELLWSALRAGSRVGVADGSQGRVRDGAPAPDVGSIRLLADSDGSGQPREPRPDQQSSREPDAVAGQPDPQAVRVRQGDRGDGLPTGDAPRLVDYAGVVWCITVPSGAFVARRNGVAFVTGNSGFPKGKANLKPAHEPIVLARKPGPLRPLAIDECRIGTDTVLSRKDGGFGANFSDDGWEADPLTPYQPHAGRWPSNVLLSSPELFDEPNPWVVGSGATSSVTGERVTHSDHRGMFQVERGIEYAGDSGGYSRFFTIPSRYNGTCVRCGLAITAGPTSSLPSPSADSAPSDAATSPDGTPDSTANGAAATTASSTKRTARSSRPAASPTIASQLPMPASLAEQSDELTDTTTTTGGPWMCGSCVAAVTSESTQPPAKPSSLELTPAARHEYPTHLIVPKADRADREPVLRGNLPKSDLRTMGDGAGEWSQHGPDNENLKRENSHPTVKPTDLMRHLVRLVTPQGGTVLDPFLGSGSTALACELEGFPWIGIEKEPEYVAIAEARLNGTQRGLGLDVGAPTPERSASTSHWPARRTPHKSEGWGFSSGQEGLKERWDKPDEEPAA